MSFITFVVNQETICNNTVTKDSTMLQVCHYTTLLY